MTKQQTSVQARMDDAQIAAIDACVPLLRDVLSSSASRSDIVRMAIVRGLPLLRAELEGHARVRELAQEHGAPAVGEWYAQQPDVARLLDAQDPGTLTPAEKQRRLRIVGARAGVAIAATASSAEHRDVLQRLGALDEQTLDAVLSAAMDKALAATDKASPAAPPPVPSSKAPSKKKASAKASATKEKR